MEMIEGFELSPQQKHLWQLQDSSPNLPYHAQCAVKIKGKIEPKILKAAIEQVISSHEILRTTFNSVPGMTLPLQVIAPDGNFNFSEYDYSGIERERQSTQIESLWKQYNQLPFDFSQNLLFHCALVNLSEEESVLLLNLPALYIDIKGLDNLVLKISNSYLACLKGEELLDEVLQYADISEWQNQLLNDEEQELILAKGYWRKQNITDCLSIKLPFEKQFQEKTGFEPRYLNFTISPSQVGQISKFTQQEKVSIDLFLLACWQILLWRITQQSEMFIGVSCEGRQYEELQDSIGLLAKYLPLKSSLQEGLLFQHVLKQIQLELDSMHTWQEQFSWESIIDKSEKYINTAFIPFSFDFTQLDQHIVDALDFSIVKYDICFDKFKVKLSFTQNKYDLAAKLYYDAKLFDEDYIQCLAEQFQTLLSSILDCPERVIDKIRILSDVEREKILLQFNDTSYDYPQDKCIHQLFEEQVEKTPDAMAVVFEQEQLTYQQLNQRANQLAHHLQSLGVGPEVLVGICVERSVEMLVGLLGILKAGGAYVPLDPSYPPERLSYMLADSGVEVLLTQQELLSSLPQNQARLVCLDTDWVATRQLSQENLGVGVCRDNLAYVIYTSGSTGKPKGTMILHSGMVNYLSWCTKAYNVADGEGSTVNSSIGFDATITSLFSPLLVGCKVLLLPEEGEIEALKAALCSGTNFSLVKITPAHLQILSHLLADEQVNIQTQAFIIGGEALSDKQTSFWQQYAPQIRLINEYGPTETVVGCCIYEVGKKTLSGGNIPIGRPIANTQIYILDKHLQPLPIGVPGELYIGGDGLARGYLNRPELTQEKFISNPFSDSQSQRLYKTGDLARYLPDGNIEFLGRIDNQVKVRGFRIELGEIESVLSKHHAVREGVVLARQDEFEQKRLVAYLVPETRQALPVLQFIRLKKQGRLDGKSVYELPNGSVIAHLHKNETEYLYQEIFEERCYLKHGITLNEGDCVFDVGANIGLFTLFTAQNCPNVKVYAFEPIPLVFDLLSINTELYDLDVKLFNIGLANKTKSESFTYYNNLSLISGRFADIEEEQNVVKSFIFKQNEDINNKNLVSEGAINELLSERLTTEQFICQLRPLSDVIKENGVEQIDLLKIDVEKSELDVLAGIREEDWSKIKQIVVEVHDINDRLAEITKLLSDRGYTLEIAQDMLLEDTDLYIIYARQASKDWVPNAAKTQLVSDWKPTWSSLNLLIKDIRQYLQQKLPEYMVPSAFVTLDTLPLTPNGKIDRKALPAPDEGINREQEYVAPRTEIEQTLTNIWQELLFLEKVSIHDNFFEIGGDSILSIQVVSRAKNSGIQITPRQIFQNQSIAELARVANTTVSVNAQQGVVAGVAPLTPIQHWFWAQNKQEPQHYNQSVLFQIPHDIKPELLEKAVEKLLEHHDALRLRFPSQASERQQINQGLDDTVPFSVVDLSSTPVLSQAQTLEQIVTEYQASLNLSSGPIMQVVLFNLGREVDARLLIIIHHLVIDGVSWRILLSDLETIYQQLIATQPIELSAKTTAFIDWAEKLNQIAQSEIIKQELDYWLNKPWSKTTSLPLDYAYTQPENTVGSAITYRVKLSVEETRALLGSVNEAYNTKINDLLLSALALSLAEWAGNSTVIIDLDGHGREELFEDVDLSRTVGWLTSLFPVLLQLPTDYQPASVIKSIKEQLRAIPHRGIGYGILRYLCEDTTVNQQLQTIPTPEISFNYLGQFDQVESQTGWKFAPESTVANHSSKQTRHHLLDINGLVVEGKLQIDWTYSSKIHTRATVENLAKSYLKAIKLIIEHCQLEDAFGYTPSDFPDAQLNQLELDELLASIKTKNISSLYPLSPMQQGMLFHSLYAPESGVYFEQMVLGLKGNVNVAALEAACQKVVDRYSVLRTFFVWEHRQTPLQVVLKQVNLPWNHLDWRGLSTTEQQRQLKELLKTQREQGFQLNQAPLVGCTLIKLSDDSYKYIWNHHHILMDGWCLPIIFQEVLSFYEAEVRGETCYLPTSRPYRDYITWLNDRDYVAASEFWQQTLQGFSAPTPLVVDKTQSQNQQQDSDDRELKLRLSPQMSRALQSVVQKHHVTLSTIVQAAWGLLLSRYSGEQDVVFGVTVSGRTGGLSGMENIVGLFINTLPLRLQISPQQQLIPWLQQIQQLMLELQDYSYTPLVEIQALSEVPGGISLFETIVVFENYPVDSSLLNEDASLQLSEIESFEQTNYPLTVVAVPGDELLVKISYDTARFESDTIGRMLGHLQTIFSAIGSNPQQAVSELPLLSEAERHQLLTEWNDTAREYPRDKCIHQLFEEQVEQTPDAVTVVFENQQLTYQQLNQRANQLAHHLQSLGVGPEVLVGICVERSLEMVVGLLGILKAGGAYVPLDPNYPPERLSYMLADSEVAVLLTQSSLLESLPEHQARVVCWDSDGSAIDQHGQDNLDVGVGSDNLAYAIYTSGSTGVPKGVGIEHRSPVALCHWAKQTFTTEQLCGVLAVTSICFDLSVFELFVTLCLGGKVIVAQNALDIINLDIAEEITLINTVPSAIAELLKIGGIPAQVQTVNLAGEPLPNQIVEQLYQYQNIERVYNLYGPSEDTTYSTFALLAKGTTEPPSIGRPIANTQIYILDKQLQPLPIDVPGELYIGGDGLARGYLNRPQLTQEKFIPNPFCNSQSERLYKTGDLARYRCDGNIEFLGRTDHQVKIRGFRIELGEIESFLNIHPQIQQAVVIATEELPGNKRLVAYVVTSERSLTTHQLGEFLLTKLPEYMVPSAFVILDALPLTPNGKVDRKALPAPDGDFTGEQEYSAPRTPSEEIVANIFASVLGVQKVGIDDNFFELGGHSLLATQVISSLNQTFSVEISLRQMFATPNVAGLVEAVTDSQLQNTEDEEITHLLAELEGLSDEEVQQLLAQEIHLLEHN